MTPSEAIDCLVALYGEPKTENITKFLDIYAKALRGMDPALLDLAITRVIKKATFWPKPSEVLAEADLAAADLYRERTPYSPPESKPQSTPEMRARVEARLAKLKEHLDVTGVLNSKDDVDWAKGSKPEFQDMQASSKNYNLHIRRQKP